MIHVPVQFEISRAERDEIAGSHVNHRRGANTAAPDHRIILESQITEGVERRWLAGVTLRVEIGEVWRQHTVVTGIDAG